MLCEGVEYRMYGSCIRLPFEGGGGRGLPRSFEYIHRFVGGRHDCLCADKILSCLQKR